MDAKATEAALARAVPLVKALEEKGVERWAALRIAAECMPHIMAWEAAYNDALETLWGLTADRMSKADAQALFDEYLGVKFIVAEESAPPPPAVDTELVRKLAMPIEALNLRIQMNNELRRGGIGHVIDLVQLLMRPHFGKGTFQRIEEGLVGMGIKRFEKIDIATAAAVRDEIARQKSATPARTTAGPR